MKKSIVFFFLASLLIAFSACERADFSEMSSEAAPAFAGDTTDCKQATVNLAPCNQSFFFTASRGGSPDNVTVFSYQIRGMGGALIDSGTIMNGGLTNPVLSTCTTYRVVIEDPLCGERFRFMITSDGCGGSFAC